MSKNYDTIEISKCCRAGVYDDYDEDRQESIVRCNKCDGECEVEEVCEYCHGEGYTESYETVYQGEPHQALTGKENCICSLDDGDPYGGDGQDD